MLDFLSQKMFCGYAFYVIANTTDHVVEKKLFKI